MSEQQSSISEGSADILGGLLESILGSQAQNPSGASIREGTPDGNAQNPFGDIFSSLLSNPDLLVKLPSIISAAKPNRGV